MTATEIERLLAAAKEARTRAYAPYSSYQVGAALLTGAGEIVTGCNIENAAYPAGLCAERVAMFKAVSEGKRQFRAIAVVTANGGSPCGMCRQVMREFAPDMIVLIGDTDGNVRRASVAELLPDSFGPEDLGFARIPA